MALRQKFIQRVKPDGSSYLEEVKVPPRSEFQLDNRDYLNEPQYKGYKHVKTIKGEKMLTKGYSQAYAENWDRTFKNGGKNGKVVHRRKKEKARA